MHTCVYVGIYVKVCIYILCAYVNTHIYSSLRTCIHLTGFKSWVIKVIIVLNSPAGDMDMGQKTKDTGQEAKDTGEGGCAPLMPDSGTDFKIRQ